MRSPSGNLAPRCAGHPREQIGGLDRRAARSAARRRRRADSQRAAEPLAHHDVPPDGSTKDGDLRMQRVGRVRQPIVAPQLVDQPPVGDRPRCRQREQRHQRLQLRPRDRHRPRRATRLHRTQHQQGDARCHAQWIPHPARRVGRRRMRARSPADPPTHASARVSDASKRASASWSHLRPARRAPCVDWDTLVIASCMRR